jgi:hypothetical protein
MRLNKKLIFFSVVAILLCLGCTTWTDQGLSQSKEDADSENVAAYLPLVMKNYPSFPSIGVAINDFSVLSEASGSYWVHYNGLLWSDIQPTSLSEYNWDNPDVVKLESNLINASAAGLEVILTVRSAPVWAQKVSNVACGPIKEDRFDEFAVFMATIVEKYSQPPYNVKYYEIWNEPDSFIDAADPDKPWGCWGDVNDPYYGGGYYANMLKVVYPAIKQVNPDVKVVLGGLLLDCDPRRPGQPGYCKDTASAQPSKFIEGILRNGGGNYIDYLNFHGYNYYSTGVTAIESERNIDNQFVHWEAYGGQIEGKLNYLSQLQATYGVDLPVLLTEAGLLDLNTPTIDFQEAKADYVVYLYVRNMAREITGTTWYTLESPGWRNSGLLQDPDRAFAAYQFLLEEMGATRYKKDLYLGSGIIAFEFEGSERIWVLFSENGSTKSISVPAGFTAAYDLYGNPVTPSNGKITFSRPVYIEFSN